MTPSPNASTLTPPDTRRRSRREKPAPGAPGAKPRCMRFCGIRNTPDTRCSIGARLARDGKVNDPIKWVWSAQPAHEPLIPKWLYDELNAQRQARRGSRDDNQPNRHPQTRRTYLLRGMLFCACGRRMYGNQRHHAAYYTCWPKNNNRGRPDKYTGHPTAVYLREDAVLDAVSSFFANRVFGRQRRTILTADLATTDDREARARDAEGQRLHRRLADIARRQTSILRQA